MVPVNPRPVGAATTPTKQSWAVFGCLHDSLWGLVLVEPRKLEQVSGLQIIHETPLEAVGWRQSSGGYAINSLQCSWWKYKRHLKIYFQTELVNSNSDFQLFLFQYFCKIKKCITFYAELNLLASTASAMSIYSRCILRISLGWEPRRSRNSDAHLPQWWDCR